MSIFQNMFCQKFYLNATNTKMLMRYANDTQLIKLDIEFIAYFTKISFKDKHQNQKFFIFNVKKLETQTKICMTKVRKGQKNLT